LTNNQPVTVLEVLQSTAAYFTRKGIEQPRLNIEHLLADTLGKKRIELYLEFDRQLTEQELAPLRAKVRRRAEGEPLQHVLGSWDFYGRTFLTDSRALVPRPETEQLLAAFLDQLQVQPARHHRLLDVGTGSGVLAITLALQNPDWEILALDVSADALSLAKANAQRFAITERLSFLESDLFGQVGGRFTGVVANLPYIPSEELAGLSIEVKHDPVRSLDGGSDGLELIGRMIRSVPQRLEADAVLALEVGPGQAERVRDLLSAENFRDISVKNDYQGVQRIVVARYG
jgi:release factor glutamine methyltransferase